MWLNWLFIICCSLFSLRICSRVESWSGHVCTKSWVTYFTERYCARYDWWTSAYGCKGWMTRQSSQLGSAQHCCDGWKHNGNKICNILTDGTSVSGDESIIQESQYADNRQKMNAEIHIVKRQVNICGGYLTAQTTIATLNSPNYPSEYANNLRCYWTIEAPVNYVIVIHITYLDLEENTDCPYDYLSINLGRNHNLETNRICTNKAKDLSFITRSNKASVTFVTDGSITKTGFSVQFQAVLNCGQHLTAQTLTATLTSPLYPTPYGNNLNCHWTIEGPVYSKIVMQITYINLEESTDCSYDYLKIYLGENYIFETDRICRNNWTDMNYISRANEADVIFVTDSSVVKTGFSLQYHAATNCGGRLVAGSTSATLSSPYYPRQYDNNLDCHWTIEASIYSRIMIHILSIDLENSGCSYDYLQVYIGSHYILKTKRMCGSNTTGLTFISGSNKADVIFVTDGSVTKTGFSLQYQAVSSCGGRLTAGTTIATLVSPNYPLQYDNYLRCHWSIEAPINYKIVINITDIELEETIDCLYDYLQIYLGNNYVLETNRICRKNNEVSNSISMSDEVYVIFITDGSVTKKGFSLQYQAVSPFKNVQTSLYKVIENQPLNVTCQVNSSSPADHISWYPRGEGSVPSRLYFSSVSRKNSGTYSCTFKITMIPTVGGQQTGTNRSQIVVDVLYPPSIQGLTSPYKVIEYQPLNVTCQVSSNPQPDQISWSPIGEASVPFRLYFSSVLRNKSGTYSCRAQNTMTPTAGGQQIGINTSQIQVDVLYAPSIQGLTSTYKVIEYQPLNVTCRDNSNPPADQISWLPIGESSVPSRLYFSSVSRNQSGTYSCTAQNTMTPTAGGQQIGRNTSQIQVDVLYTAKITEFLARDNISEIMENSTLELYCRVDSNPFSEISLSLGDVLKSTTRDSRELIHNATAGCLDAGKYICSATNSVMNGVTESAEVNLKVHCHPRPDYRKNISAEYYVALNDKVTLNVSVIAYPEPTDIMWYHRAAEADLWQQVLNKPFPSIGLHSNIFVHLCSQRDFGYYLVNMSNNFGNYERIFHVIQKEVIPDLPAFQVGPIAGGVASGAIVAVICIILVIIFMRRRNLRNKENGSPLELRGSTNETSHGHGVQYEELHVNMTETGQYLELTDISRSSIYSVRKADSDVYDELHLYSNAAMATDTSKSQENIPDGENVIYENTRVHR